MSTERTHCELCGLPFAAYAKGGAPGYAVDFDTGASICYGCMAARDRAWMLARKWATLFVKWEPDEDTGKHKPVGVINWPGTLRFPLLSLRRGSHNMTGLRWDVWFNGPDGHVWHGVNYGTHDLVYCKHTKRKAER